MRALTLVLSLALLLAAATLPTQAAPEAQHPLLVMKATLDNNNTNAARNTHGTATIWLKNVSDVTVDGVKVELRLVDGSRKVQSLVKDVGSLEAGKKAFLDYKWEEYNERKLKPQIWVTYNGANGPVTFRGEPPVW